MARVKAPARCRHAEEVHSDHRHAGADVRMTTAMQSNGNKNAIKGPRLGRKDKPVTNDVPAPAPPQLRPAAKLEPGPHRARGRTGRQ
jgi:hypothetical protein